MDYPIKKDLIPGLPRDPYRNGVGAYEGVVAHSTATPEATAEAESVYFHREWDNRNAFVHFFVDWDSIVQTASTDYRAWGAGKGNARYVHVELCETSDHAKFIDSYRRYCWLIAHLLKERNLKAIDGQTLVSHAWVSKNLGGTDHMDPLAYLTSHGVTWNEFVNDVRAVGDAPKRGWVKENSVWYFYENNERRTGWLQDKGKWYYLHEVTGAMITGWYKVADNWYYFDTHGVMQVGWNRSSSKWYYLDEKGKMATGEREINGVKYNFNNSGSLIE
ncbi:N-acetylmuramoyl-L-alanine amidase [Neobacillus sp. PS2-9]|uniref:peptidoglycan recognition protein family protein n=1 Tax=Neobacillus sp. PS2-9 TaxID=3070676 RepID=UPI0027DEDA4D|nr:N-acetylmuramoyl-L-alanine amidase [Neobacillus sp. PS2-9]WML58859.1 N-acetylmuramoyl-L-alanine amidase [Neobacillus sp. PS2-9]